ncbi:MAG: hypothetical protein RMZ41_000680 [Nostoc sp. DedVER02]|uniref:hypothetical protein n=1 Tax=unclassified Nostoc TaxID=2593658 RepID=UPI002AD30CEB|nr:MULTISPECIES: hypothetical protein [unclassified Nostoc]MDZ7988008.1 hypothetical protein [Nostoc sp. DedVER02]MDZ8114933.1 hypothetical protein [Nostoc sp. DedVER01b]
MLTDDPQRQWLTFWLCIWVVVVALVICSQWNKRLPSVGLPMIYLIQLSILHWFGAMIYAFPWYNPKSAYLISQKITLTNTAIGFTQAVYGVIAFAVGSIILAPLVEKILKPSGRLYVPRQPNLKFPNNYILLGVFFYFVLGPILGRIPSISVLVNSGFVMLSTGLCLACWKAWYMREKHALMRWLLISCCIPFVSIINSGFASFGVMAVVPVLIFVFTFYRPRWKSIILLVLFLSLGLSFYTNYFRDRNLIRAQVWGGKGIESRIEQLQQTASNLEFFDPSKQAHLELIDGRLNQNPQVGQGVRYISSGAIEYANGETFAEAAVAVVPRILWPDKPISGGSGDIVNRYTGVKFAEGTSVGVGNILEFYINFGTEGVILGFAILGILLRVIDIIAGKKLLSGDWEGFTFWFLPGLAMINPGGSLTEIVGSVAGSVVLVYLINKFYVQKRGRSKALGTTSY